MSGTRKRAARGEGIDEPTKRLRSAVDDSFNHLVCAITQELPLEPVTAEDGHIYERAAIEGWLKQVHKSPMTNMPMGPRLMPALQVKSTIQSMVECGAIAGEKAESLNLRREAARANARLRERAEAGDSEAMRMLAHKLWAGDGLAKDGPESFLWWERSARLGNVRAIGALGSSYLTGRGVEVDIAVGLAFLVESGARGNAMACVNLGNAHARGKHGLPLCRHQARRWFEKARVCENWEETPEPAKKAVAVWLNKHASGQPCWALP